MQYQSTPVPHQKVHNIIEARRLNQPVINQPAADAHNQQADHYARRLTNMSSTATVAPNQQVVHYAHRMEQPVINKSTVNASSQSDQPVYN